MIHIDQEIDQVPPRIIRRSALIVTIAIIVSIGATVLLEGGHVVDSVVIDTTRPERIETTPFPLASEAEKMRAAAELRLDTYGWADRARATIHVPLEVAIDQYLGAPR
jgi:hypothetical protein